MWVFHGYYCTLLYNFRIMNVTHADGRTSIEFAAPVEVSPYYDVISQGLGWVASRGLRKRLFEAFLSGQNEPFVLDTSFRASQRIASIAFVAALFES